MVRQPTEYSKREHAIQEAYAAALHLRKSRVLPLRLDAQNEWSGARKVMKKAEALRVLLSPKVDFRIANPNSNSTAENSRAAVNALDANARGSTKRTLNAVVEVQYTTGILEVAE
jgi:hypothetical protein